MRRQEATELIPVDVVLVRHARLVARHVFGRDRELVEANSAGVECGAVSDGSDACAVDHSRHRVGALVFGQSATESSRILAAIGRFGDRDLRSRRVDRELQRVGRFDVARVIGRAIRQRVRTIAGDLERCGVGNEAGAVEVVLGRGDARADVVARGQGDRGRIVVVGVRRRRLKVSRRDRCNVVERAGRRRGLRRIADRRRGQADRRLDRRPPSVRVMYTGTLVAAPKAA